MEGPIGVSSQPFHVRSISMPCRSHPTMERVREELHKVRNSVASSSSPSTSSTRAKEMCNGLTSLGDLYACIDDLLHLPSIRQACFSPDTKKWLEKELDESLSLMDLCSTMKDALATIEELVQDLQLAHRRKWNMPTEDKVRAHVTINKQTMKIVKKLQKALKQVERKSRSCAPTGEDCDLLMAVRVMKEARQITISLLGLVLSFLSMEKTKLKKSKWSVVSKAMHKSKVACEKENEDENEVGNADVSIHSSCGIISFKDLEARLECLFRQQIQNRVSLLNILSV